MSELIVAVLIFVISQFTLKLLIEPFIEFKKVISEISYQTLLNQSNIISSPLSNKELAQTFKHLSASLIKAVDSIIGYRILRLISFFSLPKYKDIREASKELNLIYYSLHTGEKNVIEINDSLKKISKYLKISTSYSH